MTNRYTLIRRIHSDKLKKVCIRILKVYINNFLPDQSNNIDCISTLKKYFICVGHYQLCDFVWMQKDKINWLISEPTTQQCWSTLTDLKNNVGWCENNKVYGVWSYLLKLLGNLFFNCHTNNVYLKNVWLFSSCWIVEVLRITPTLNQTSGWNKIVSSGTSYACVCQ